MDSEQVTTVSICNRSYNVRSGNDPEYVRDLARYVDRKMMELSQNTPTVDTLKVAVLAALNIADDYMRTKQELDRVKGSCLDKTEKMSEKLTALLGTEVS